MSQQDRAVCVDIDQRPILVEVHCCEGNAKLDRNHRHSSLLPSVLLVKLCHFLFQIIKTSQFVTFIPTLVNGAVGEFLIVVSHHVLLVKVSSSNFFWFQIEFPCNLLNPVFHNHHSLRSTKSSESCV